MQRAVAVIGPDQTLVQNLYLGSTEPRNIRPEERPPDNKNDQLTISDRALLGTRRSLQRHLLSRARRPRCGGLTRTSHGQSGHNGLHQLQVAIFAVMIAEARRNIYSLLSQLLSLLHVCCLLSRARGTVHESVQLHLARAAYHSTEPQGMAPRRHSNTNNLDMPPPSHYCKPQQPSMESRCIQRG